MERGPTDAVDRLFINSEPYRHGLPEGTFPDSSPLDSFPIVDDLRVLPVPDLTGHFGVHMRWVSDAHGVIAVFPWWDHLERDRDRQLIVPGDFPVGSLAAPFVHADHDWGIRIWLEGSWVCVVHDGGGGWTTWFRVPLDVFTAAWRAGIARIRMTYAPLSPESVAPRRAAGHPD